MLDFSDDYWCNYELLKHDRDCAIAYIESLLWWSDGLPEETVEMLWDILEMLG